MNNRSDYPVLTT